MSLRRLQRRCEARLRDLTLPDHLTVEGLRSVVAEMRGRPVHLLAMPSGLADPQLCGLWVATDAADYVFVAPATSPVHRDAITLHELAHIVCGHDAQAQSPDEGFAALVPSLSSDVVHLMMARAGYGNEQEREAELMSSLLLARLRTPSTPSTPPAAAGGEVLGRLSRVLGAER